MVMGMGSPSSCTTPKLVYGNWRLAQKSISVEWKRAAEPGLDNLSRPELLAHWPIATGLPTFPQNPKKLKKRERGT